MLEEQERFCQSSFLEADAVARNMQPQKNLFIETHSLDDISLQSIAGLIPIVKHKLLL